MAHDAGIAGFTRMDKAKLAVAITAKPSEYLHFLDCLKKAEAEAENEWLNGVARIARGAGIATTVTEELDAAENVKARTTRTVTGRGSWQAYAWLLERRHPERWSRTERPAAGVVGAGTLDPVAPASRRQSPRSSTPPKTSRPGPHAPSLAGGRGRRTRGCSNAAIRNGGHVRSGQRPASSGPGLSTPWRRLRDDRHRGARRRRKRQGPDHTHRHWPGVVAGVRVAARTPPSGTVVTYGAASGRRRRGRDSRPRGAGFETIVTEELDAAGHVKARTTRTVTGRGSWQAYAWLLERRHPERWSRTERPAAGVVGAGTLDPVAPASRRSSPRSSTPPGTSRPGPHAPSLAGAGRIGPNTVATG